MFFYLNIGQVYSRTDAIQAQQKVVDGANILLHAVSIRMLITSPAAVHQCHRRLG